MTAAMLVIHKEQCVAQQEQLMLARATIALLMAGTLVACVSTPPPTQLRLLPGLELYERLCASCHGVEGHGDGPVAPSIKVGVPDLTRLAARDGGEFPTEDVRRIIDGRADRRAHGPRDMPVWGWQLYDLSDPDYAAERARTDAMIDRLVTHLKSIQQP